MAIVFRNVEGMTAFKDSVNGYVRYMKVEKSHLSKLAEVIQQGSPDDDECQKAIKDIFELTEYLDDIIKFFDDVGSQYGKKIREITARTI